MPHAKMHTRTFCSPVDPIIDKVRGQRLVANGMFIFFVPQSCSMD